MPVRFLDRVAAHPATVAFQTLEGDRWSWAQWGAASRAVAAALIADGVEPGDRVAVLAGNAPLWPVVDMGILLAGAVSVGLYPSAAPVQIEEVLADAGAALLIVGHPTQLARVRAARSGHPPVRRVVVGPAIAAADDVLTWDAWQALADDAAHRAVEARLGALTASQDAAIIYTSGSTGDAKGARLTHETIAASADVIVEALALSAADRTLSFLPFAHAAERIFGLYTRITAGMSALLVDDITRVFEAAVRYEPTLFGGLPRFYEKAYEALHAEPDPARVRAGLAAHFGTKVRVATSGGATLAPHVAAFLARHGLPVQMAYGLTEHLCVTMQRPGAHATDHVGTPMGGTTLRIADDGEILVARSALTFAGYHARAQETAEAFTPDGRWLRTGDLGVLTARGELRVTGRAKELIALSGGKKVAPVRMEAAICRDPLVAQAVVFGEGERYLVAILTPNEGAVQQWAAARGLDGPIETLLAHELVYARFAAAVDEANREFSRPEQVKRFLVLPRRLTVEGGELTPTFKPRRAALAETFAPALRRLYEVGT
jgi:long-chain acyl-CoA synthetase